MKKSALKQTKYYIYGLLFIVAIWVIFSLLFDENEIIFPSVFAVAKETGKALVSTYTYKCLLSSFVRLIIGFAVSLLLALIIGTIAGNNEKIKYFISPMITVLKTIPTASLVFLFLVISGAKYAPIYIVALICFPIIYEATLGGYENIDNSISNALALEGDSLKAILKIKFPLASPYIMVGIASSLGLSFKIEVMAEVLCGSTSSGLGSIISYIQKSDPTNMSGIFAYSLIAVATSLLIGLICEKIQKNN